MTKTKKADQAREARYVEPGGSRLRADASEQRLALFEVETPQRRMADLVVPDGVQIGRAHV